MQFVIRNVRTEDLEQVAKVEAECFLQAEAAGLDCFRSRIAAFPGSFFVAEIQGGIIGFINGCVTDEKLIRDQMFADSRLHKPKGAYQSIFGLAVVSEYQKQGVATGLMKRMIEEAVRQGRKGLILTCKEHLIPFYNRFGYHNMGVSASVHGGAVWYDLLLELKEVCR